MRKPRVRIEATFHLLGFFVLLLASSAGAQPGDWSFTVAGDMRRYVVYQGIHGWDDACRAMATVGPGAFLVSPGDLDQQYTSNPGDYVYQIVEQEIAPGFPFFPGVGNHEFDDVETMDWIRAFDHGGPSFDVNPGPPGSENTTYSWDHGNAHFVMLNQCFDGVDDIGAIEGNWNLALDAWLRADLTAAGADHTFVFGHFPAFPQPDRDTGVELHMNDTDFNVFNGGEYRDALWAILQEHDVTAYICGHTHASSAVMIDGVWQVDLGHARGPRSPDWHGPSTFLKFLMSSDGSVTLETWRQPYTVGEGNEAPYTLWHTDEIAAPSTTGVGPIPVPLVEAVWPNPFNPSVMIRLAGRSSAEILDVSGRRVRTLALPSSDDTPRTLTWHGRDDAGRPMPSGAYRLVVMRDGRQESRTLTLLR